MAACGWCLAFNDECCQGRFAWCEHGRRCDVTNLRLQVHWNDSGKGWCYEHGRQDWCSNIAKREVVPMSAVTDTAEALLDAEVAKVLADPASIGGPMAQAAAKQRARGMVEQMAVFLGRDADELAHEAVARVQAHHG